MNTNGIPQGFRATEDKAQLHYEAALYHPSAMQVKREREREREDDGLGLYPTYAIG